MIFRPNYKQAYDFSLPYNVPLIININIRNFQRLTKNLQKPYSPEFLTVLGDAFLDLCSEIPGCYAGYFQHNEGILVLKNECKEAVQPWLQNNIQSLVSIISSLFTQFIMGHLISDFDLIGNIVVESSAKTLPDTKEVVAEFQLQQASSLETAINLVSRKHFSQQFGKKTARALEKKSPKEKLRLLTNDCGIDFVSTYPLPFRLGVACYKVPKLIKPAQDGMPAKYQKKWMIDWEVNNFFSEDSIKLLTEIINNA